MKINIIQAKIAENKQESFWYEGQIATIETDHGVYSLEACGDIRLDFGEPDDVYKNWSAVEHANDLGLTDNDLELLRDRDAFGNNNWFEVVCIRENGEVDSCIGDVDYTYDDAIVMLETAVEDEIYKMED